MNRRGFSRMLESAELGNGNTGSGGSIQHVLLSYSLIFLSATKRFWIVSKYSERWEGGLFLLVSASSISSSSSSSSLLLFWLSSA
jgi:hypothetical protein